MQGFLALVGRDKLVKGVQADTMLVHELLDLEDAYAIVGVLVSLFKDILGFGAGDRRTNNLQELIKLVFGELTDVMGIAKTC